MVNVVLAGGGTAGHTSPLIATAMALQERGATVSCIGTPRGLEGRVIPEAGLQLDMIPPVPLPRTVNADLFKVPARLAGAVREAGEVLQRRQTDVVVGFGGYVSLPAYLAARRAKIPVVIHEQNAVPGLANKIAARFAVFVGTAFPDTPLPKARFVGMPLRSQITDLADASGQARAERCVRARADLGLDINRPTLLVSGALRGRWPLMRLLLLRGHVYLQTVCRFFTCSGRRTSGGYEDYRRVDRSVMVARGIR